MGTKLEWILWFIVGFDDQEDEIKRDDTDKVKVIKEKLEKFGLESLRGDDMKQFILEKFGYKEFQEKIK